MAKRKRKRKRKIKDEPKSFKFKYEALVTKVHDGDSIEVQIDLGFKIYITRWLRLSGLDAPELRGEEREEGEASRDWLEKQIKGKKITVHTIKDKKGKYGRYLAKLYIDEEKSSLNDLLIKNGLAIVTEY